MAPCLDDHKVVAIDAVHEAVRFGDPPGPAASEHVSQRLGLADTGGRVPQGVVDQAVDAPKRRPVKSLPPPVVVPPVTGEDKPHLARPAMAVVRCSGGKGRLVGDLAADDSERGDEGDPVGI